MKHNFFMTVLFVATLIITACASSPIKKEQMPPLNGMIYDRDNRPVSDTMIQLDGKFMASSDIYGHFTLSSLKSNEPHALLITKKGYEKSEMDFVFSDPTQVVYVQMYSAPQLIAEAENAIQAQDWFGAESFILRAETAGGDAASIGYLRAVIAFKKEQYDTAVKILTKLQTESQTQPYISLFLADIFQYKLDDNASAKMHLRKFLESRYDPDVELRLKNLNAQKETEPQL